MAKSKLELDLEIREFERKNADRRYREAEAERLENERKERIHKFRADAKRLFTELFDNVDVTLTDSTLEFEVKGDKYFISYDYYHIPKTPGDVDDYDISGYDWHLRKTYRSTSDYYTLYAKETSGGYKPRTDLYEQVLRGIEELNKTNGRRW